MAGSTIVVFKSALLAALQARAGLTGVQTEYADKPNTSRREILFFGATEIGDTEYPVMRAGRIKREENYTVRVHVVVAGQPTPVANETRALAIAREVEEYLADNPTVGDASGVLFALVEGMTVTTLETTDGPYTEMDIAVAVKARLL